MGLDPKEMDLTCVQVSLQSKGSPYDGQQITCVGLDRVSKSILSCKGSNVLQRATASGQVWPPGCSFSSLSQGQHLVVLVSFSIDAI